eukprot:m.303009 g.303009  ORF g.303009 m.303009 type:complete len:99 (+) comp15890_c0_seq31:805-1101(+)
MGFSWGLDVDYHPSILCSPEFTCFVFGFQSINQSTPLDTIPFGLGWKNCRQSTNKTYLNDEAIEPHRYYELRVQDKLKFGYSTRIYIVMRDDVAAADE